MCLNMERNGIKNNPDDEYRELINGYHGAERRRKPRLYMPFPATVHGVNASGVAFEAHTHLDNLSAGGTYFRITQRVEEGAKVFMVTRLSLDLTGEAPAPRVAIRGVVLRVEPQSDGTFGVAARITRSRCL